MKSPFRSLLDKLPTSTWVPKDLINPTQLLCCRLFFIVCRNEGHIAVFTYHLRRWNIWTISGRAPWSLWTSSTSRAQAPIHISVSFVRPGNEKKNRQPSMPSGWQTGEKNHSNIILYTLLPHSRGWWVAPTYWQTFFYYYFALFSSHQQTKSELVNPSRLSGLTRTTIWHTQTHTHTNSPLFSFLISAFHLFWTSFSKPQRPPSLSQ